MRQRRKDYQEESAETSGLSCRRGTGFQRVVADTALVILSYSGLSSLCALGQVSRIRPRSFLEMLILPTPTIESAPSIESATVSSGPLGVRGSLWLKMYTPPPMITVPQSRSVSMKEKFHFATMLKLSSIWE